MDRALVQYAVNVAWQLPILAAGAWLLIRAAKPAAATQHRIWVAVLMLAVALPAIGVLTASGAGFAGAQENEAPAHRPSVELAIGSTPVESSGTQAPMLSSAIAPTTHWITKAGAMLTSLRFTQRIEISSRTAEWVTGVYLLVMLLGLARILRAWIGTRRLIMLSQDAEMTHPEQTLVAECARSMGIKKPEIRVLNGDTLAGPAVVGAARPVLLCPKGFVQSLLESERANEATAALCHEMAHIRRHDYAVNLICEAMTAPLRWHPVAYGVEQRIRRTREMACDTAAARAMESEAEYARCLVKLAEQIAAGQMVQQPGAVGLFNGNALEERVMQLVEIQTTMSTRAKIMRRIAGTAAMAAAVVLVGMVHVIPAEAQVPATPARVSEARPPVQVPPTKLMVPAAPTLPVEPAARPEPPIGPQIPSAPPERPKAIPSPRIEAQLAEAQNKLAAAEARINSPQFKEQIQQAERAAQQAAEARINSPQFKEQIQQATHAAQQAAKAQIDSQQFKELIQQAVRARMEAHLAKAQKKIAAAEAQIDSQQFKEQIQQAAHAAQQAASKAVQVPANVMAGYRIGGEEPTYPKEAKEKHIQGTVVLHALISREGTIKDLTVVSGPKILSDSAVKAVRTWRYKMPYMYHGKSVEVSTTINVVYTLGESSKGSKR